MREWEEKDLKFILDKKYFPNCIECDGHFFHKEGCQRGHGDWKIINEPLNKRLEEFEKKYGVNGIGIQCKECTNAAVGTMQVFYHHSNSIIEEWPVCMDHAYHEDSEGRECKFVGF